MKDCSASIASERSRDPTSHDEIPIDMAKRTQGQTKRNAKRSTSADVSERVRAVLEKLEALGSQRVRDDMLHRYGIVTDYAFGVGMSAMQKLAKEIGHDHALAAGLWKTGCYEARTVAVFVEEIELVTAAQMDRWARDFDNWAICDTTCFKLFDRSPHAFEKIAAWSKRKPEFERRAAFALLASVALHDKNSSDETLLRCLPLAEAAASDERNFVKKSVSWALRALGGRSSTLHAATLELARRLAASSESTPRWIGKDVLRDIQRPLVVQRAAKRSRSK